MAKDKNSRPDDSRRESIGQSSRVISTKFDDIEGAEQTEIAAQITVPTDGGWGWVVLIAAFFCSFLLDGCVVTFGALLKDIAEDLECSDGLVAGANSIQAALYLMLSPIASAFINRFGFRTCGMLGSIICCYSALGSSLSKGVSSFYFLFGFCYGVGCCFLNMAANLVVGFYFEKYRSQAMTFVTFGSSCGTMLMFPVYLVLVNLAGWRSTVLLQSGILGSIFFFTLTFRPLLSLTVTKVDEEKTEPTRTVTYLPTLTVAKTASGKPAQANTMERMFGAVSNVRFPTASNVIKDVTTATAGPSQKMGPSRITLSSGQGVSKAQLDQVKSMVSRGAVKDQPPVMIEIKVTEPLKRKSCWARLCNWQSHSPSSRPMYRDDVFYDGKVQKLPQFPAGGDGNTGLEYQMAVSRAITVNDLQDKRGVLTTGVRRILVTMCDVDLLKKKSFLVYSLSGMFGYVGLNIPYIFVQDRNLEAGIDAQHCTYFVSVIAFANAFGRMFWSIVAMKMKSLDIWIVGFIISGVSTALSSLSFNPWYQYCYCFVFGLCICVPTSMRSIIIVELYGLERLTNGTGLLLLFMGFGNLFGTPTAGILKDLIGYNVAFYFAGVLMTLAGLLGILVSCAKKLENKKSTREQQTTAGKNIPKSAKDIKTKSEGIGTLKLPKQADQAVQQKTEVQARLETLSTPVAQPTPVMHPLALTVSTPVMPSETLMQPTTSTQSKAETYPMEITMSRPVMQSKTIMLPMTNTQSKTETQSTSVTLSTPVTPHTAETHASKVTSATYQ